MGTATMKFNEGIIVKGSAGNDTHSLVVTGSTFVNGDITCNNISIGADTSGTGRTISAGNTDTSIRFNSTDGVDIVVGGVFFISCDENASQDTIVFNTSGHDIDFRVESDNKEYQIFSDAGNDLLVIGSDVEMPAGVGSDTNVIISGSAAGQGQVVFTGNVVSSGSISTKSNFIVDGSIGVGTETPVTKLDIHQNPTSLANDTGGGEVVTFGTGTLTAGKLYYLNTSSTWSEVDADAVASGADQLLGIALGSSPSSDGVLIRGFFDAHSYLSNFSAGKAVYISTTAGGMDTTAPSGEGDFVRIVGYCTATSNVIYFNPSSAWVEL